MHTRLTSQIYPCSLLPGIRGESAPTAGLTQGLFGLKRILLFATMGVKSDTKCPDEQLFA